MTESVYSSSPSPDARLSEIARRAGISITESGPSKSGAMSAAKISATVCNSSVRTAMGVADVMVKLPCPCSTESGRGTIGGTAEIAGTAMRRAAVNANNCFKRIIGWGIMVGLGFSGVRKQSHQLRPQDGSCRLAVRSAVELERCRPRLAALRYKRILHLLRR